mgnify:CR=1 FL=1
MANELGNLGLASNVLTTELWQKLKTAEESSRIKPYETKIEKITTKQKAITELTTKLNAFKSAVSSLGDASAFQKRKVTPSVTGDNAAATLTASSGVSVQNLSVKVDKIAQKDVFQSKGLVKDTDRILTANQKPASFTIMQNGKEYTIKVEATTTYADLADKINSATDGKVIAKIVSTGEKGTPYRFTLSSKETGADNAISFFAGTKNSQTGVYNEDPNATAILGNLGWTLKKDNIAEADMKGFAFSGGTKASSVKNLNTETIGKDIKFTLWAGKEKFEISANANETYDALQKKIETKTQGKIKLSAVKSGNDYTFNFVAGDKASSSTKIKIFDGISTTDTSGNKTYASNADTTSFLEQTLKIGISKSYSLDDTQGTAHLKKAQDAEFTLDGVKMYRSSNSITDIGVGINLNLLKPGEINFDIKQDVEGLSGSMEELVEKYNDLANYLTETMSYNTETKTSGDLNGVAEVSNLRSTLVSKLFASKSVEGYELDKDGNKKPATVFLSLTDYGLSISKEGLLSFKKEDFDKKLNADVEAAEKLFAGTSGFETLDITSKASQFKNIDFTNNKLSFRGKDFKIIFNDKTYDLTKTVDGKDFELIGNTPEERAKNLLDHINSFSIGDLKVTMKKLTITEAGNQVEAYTFNFKSDNGSDFELTGEKAFLNKLGFTAEKKTINTKTGTGVLAELKDTIQGYTKISLNNNDLEKGSLTLYSDSLTKESKRLQESKKTDQEKINEKFETMFNQWAAYEKIMSNIKTQANAISQMISASQQNKS